MRPDGYPRWRLTGSVALVLLSACASAPASIPSAPTAASQTVDATPTPTGTPTATAASTASPTATASEEASPTLGPDAIAEVVTTDLVARSLPEISDASIIDPVTLSEPKLLFVLDGPVRASGFDWYLVAPFDECCYDIVSPSPRLGWVAAGGDGETWIAPWSGACPEPSVEELLRLWGYLRVACFGNRPLTLDGELGQCDYTLPGPVTPVWLAAPFCQLYPSDTVDEFLAGVPLLVYLEPEHFEIPVGPRQPVRVIGHFDHPAAQTCEHHPTGDQGQAPPELVILACRSAFVATSIESIDGN